MQFLSASARVKKNIEKVQTKFWEKKSWVQKDQESNKIVNQIHYKYGILKRFQMKVTKKFLVKKTLGKKISLVQNNLGQSRFGVQTKFRQKS